MSRHPESYNFNRRDFLGSAAALSASAAFGTLAADMLAAPIDNSPKGPFVGVHIAAHSFYDEGFDRCLDFLQETAGVNNLFVTSNSYYGAMFRPKAAQGYHGVPLRDGVGRKVTKIFFKPNEKNYAGTTLRHKPLDSTLEYAGKEVFVDLAEPARQRGMKIFERLYEPGGGGLVKNIVGAERIRTVDVFGEPGERACWNNPDYLNWVEAHVKDLFSSYKLDGIQYGAERNGPLSRLVDWARETPTCFCEHCRERAEKESVDFERAKAGLSEMTRFIRSLEKGGQPGPDGAFVGFLRILMQHPAILAWEDMHYRAGEELHQRLYDTIRSINPQAHVGRHIDHAQSSWDMFFRAAMPYSRMTPCSDFLKISTYHDILGPRLAHRLEAGYCRHILREFSPEQALALFYAITGHDPQVELAFEKLAEEGFSPEYVYRETKRAVEGVVGKSAVYSGIAIDIPVGRGWGTEASPSDPDEAHRAVCRARDEGHRSTRSPECCPSRGGQGDRGEAGSRHRIRARARPLQGCPVDGPVTDSRCLRVGPTGCRGAAIHMRTWPGPPRHQAIQLDAYPRR